MNKDEIGNVIVFFDGNKLRPELLDQDARSWAERLVIRENKKDKRGKPVVEFHGVSGHQLRRLYDEVKHYQKLLDDKKKLYPEEKDRGWNEVKPLVKMVRAKTAYMVARLKDKTKNFKTKKAYDSLYDFIDKSLNLINEEDHFNAFCLFFEAVYGFYYHLGGASTK